MAKNELDVEYWDERIAENQARTAAGKAVSVPEAELRDQRAEAARGGR
jgi:hypothetical protein